MFQFAESIISYARHLRKNQTDAEKILWNILRGRKVKGYKFRRQHPIDNKYILDFYCVEKRLAIELDGNHHQWTLQKKMDDERSEYLNFRDIKVIRFTNNQVLFHTNETIRTILKELK